MKTTGPLLIWRPKMAATANSIITPQTINEPAVNVLLSTAMTSTKALDGTEAAGTSMGLVFTAGANGSQLPPLRVKVSSTNGAATPSGTTTATVVRVWLNKAPTGVNTTAANNIYLDELAVPATLYSTTAATTTLSLDFSNLVIPAGWKVYAGMTSTLTVAGAALCVSMPGGGDL